MGKINVKNKNFGVKKQKYRCGKNGVKKVKFLM